MELPFKRNIFSMVLIFISKHFPKINLNLFVSEEVKHPHKVAR